MTLAQTCWRLSGPDVRLQVLHCAPLDLVTPTKDKYNPLASPAWGSNGDGLGGIAPALIVTAEFDRLRDQAAAYARKLKDVGALAEYHQVGGLDHVRHPAGRYNCRRPRVTHGTVASSSSVFTQPW